MTHCISLAVIRSGSVGLQYQSGRGIHLPTVRIKPITNNQWKRHKESLKASMSSLLEEKFSMILNHIGEWTEEWDPTFCLRILSAQLSNNEGVHTSTLSLRWMTWPQILTLYEHFTWGEATAIKMGLQKEKLTMEEFSTAWKGSNDEHAGNELMSQRTLFTSSNIRPISYYFTRSQRYSQGAS